MHASEVPFAGGVAQLRFTGAAEGDLAWDQPPEVLGPRRAAVTDMPWLWMRQVHGSDVVTATSPADAVEAAGTSADAATTAADGLALAVHTADCAPVLLVSPEGVIAAAHAGWRGIADGVLAATVAAMGELGASSPHAVLGPCIGPECYEFGEAELAGLAELLGPEVRSRTRTGAPALDLPAAVDAALAAAGVAPAGRVGPCTACAAGEFYSHRARADRQRQAAVVWREQR